MPKIQIDDVTGGFQALRDKVTAHQAKPAPVVEPDMHDTEALKSLEAVDAPPATNVLAPTFLKKPAEILIPRRPQNYADETLQKLAAIVDKADELVTEAIAWKQAEDAQAGDAKNALAASLSVEYQDAEQAIVSVTKAKAKVKSCEERAEAVDLVVAQRAKVAANVRNEYQQRFNQLDFTMLVSAIRAYELRKHEVDEWFRGQILQSYADTPVAFRKGANVSGKVLAFYEEEITYLFESADRLRQWGSSYPASATIQVNDYVVISPTGFLSMAISDGLITN